jgi:hypothetical protein
LDFRRKFGLEKSEVKGPSDTELRLKAAVEIPESLDKNMFKKEIYEIFQPYCKTLYKYVPKTAKILLRKIVLSATVAERSDCEVSTHGSSWVRISTWRRLP